MKQKEMKSKYPFDLEGTTRGNNILRHLQAGILKPHGRDFTAQLLLKFRADKRDEIRAFIAALPIDNALDQRSRSLKKMKEQSFDPYRTLTNLFLTYGAYEKLGILKRNRPKDPAFVAGMAERGLQDPPVEEWEFPFHEEFEAMLHLANDDRAILEGQIADLKKQTRTFLSIVQIQFGVKLQNHLGQTIEHFGYVDGISQPLFFSEALPDEGIDQWDPRAPWSLALVDDPATSVKDACGSYLVYRKLEQNVKAFKQAEEQLAHQLGFSGEAEEIAGAMIVGRFEHGQPMIRFGNTPSPEIKSKANNFNYQVDPEGSRCPFHAHIRKVNPRGEASRIFNTSFEEERRHRIVRRGITYDDIGRNAVMSVQPEGGVGLLFLCFQADIENQFEFMQRFWSNNNDFPAPYTGIDPLIGQGANRKNSDGQAAEQKWMGIDRKTYSASLSSFVNMLGGAYFFAPSIPFLRSLSTV